MNKTDLSICGNVTNEFRNPINDDFGNDRNPLYFTCQTFHKHMIELLMEKKVDLNSLDKYGYNVLHLASVYGHKDIVEFLIEKGIDINKKDKNGYNALHFACESGHREIAELLIENGIDMSETDNYWDSGEFHLAKNW